MAFNHNEIEKKWQQKWEENNSFKTTEDDSKKRFYCLDMFPFPSGSGLHVGHPEGYTATDIIARKKRMEGFNVLHPMGWDAFGLPAEQFAINTGNSPIDFTYQNIEVFKKQIKALGFSYDWEKEFATCDHDYYRWTQWIFYKIYEMGLAELKEVEVNWCEELGTVLANDEIEEKDGVMVSERGGFKVTKKALKQWVLKITNYADRLLEDLDLVKWPENLKEMQRNWIGKSIGANVTFSITNSELSFDVFTTRPDTLYGATYCVIAPEKDLVLDIVTEEYKEEVIKYIELTKSKSDIDRSKGEKTGVFTGRYAVNPINNKEIPIWIGDYVLASYGSGCVMAVPCHDQRDYEFAKKNNLDFIQVIEGDYSEKAITGDDKHINSDILNGLINEDAKVRIIEELVKLNKGKKEINYKLRDWLFSRQRYWAEPFPIAHKDGKIIPINPIKEDVILPIMEDFKPSGTTEGPLANATEWLNHESGRRETNTMPQTAGSAWYYIGFILKTLDGFADLDSEEAKEKINKWLPVDLYIGGAEHAVGHLLYARFWHKVLFDLGIVDTKEPFMKLFNQGMILGTDNQKMSKSKGNVINPDDIVSSHGADTLRLYEMFMGPLDQEKPWSEKGVDGARKFLERVYRLFIEIATIEDSCKELDKVYNQTVKKVTEDYDKLAFNTAISQMMIFVNEATKLKKVSKAQAIGFIKLLNPIAPHLTSEIFSSLTNEDIVYSSWPTFDESKLVESEITMVVQVNGKVRDKLTIDANMPKDEIEKLARNSEKVIEFTKDLNIVKVIVVPKKLVSIVAK